MFRLVTFLSLAVLSSAWTFSNQVATPQSRQAFLQTTAAASVAALFVPPALAGDSVDLPNGVSYTVSKSGTTGIKPDSGELIAIRFKAFCGEQKIDDIFDTPEPYYTRVGSGGLLKGVEATLPMMSLGDRWVLTIPSELAFGKQGRSASAGRPRIPSDATIVFDVEVVGIPGKEPELIELIGDA